MSSEEEERASRELDYFLENWPAVMRIVSVHRTHRTEDGRLMNVLGELVRHMINARALSRDLSDRVALLTDEQILGEGFVEEELKGGIMALGMDFACMGAACFELMKSVDEQEEDFREGGVLP